MEVYKIDSRVRVRKFFYDNFSSSKFNLVTTILKDFFKVDENDKASRNKVDALIQENGKYLSWSASDKSVHYIARVA